MKSSVKSNLRCSENELYSVAQTGWASFEEHLAAFTLRKPIYTAAYAAAAKAEIAAAMALPNRDARIGAQQLLRLQLIAAAYHAIFHWNLLESHTSMAYPEEQVSVRLSAAGEAYYTAASNNDWENVESLMTSGYTFMLENEADLAANNNMPANFTADYTDARNNFAAAYIAFKKAEMMLAAQTDAKRLANIAVYKKLRDMFKDATLYFKKEPLIKQYFVFNNILAIVSPPSPASLKGIISNASNAHLPGAVLSLFNGTDTNVAPHYTATAASNGAYDFGNIAGAKYTLKIEHPSFVTRLEPIKVSTGVTSTKNFTLAPL